jgi:Uma2 family endonuclease
MVTEAQPVRRGPDFPDGDGDAMPERSSHQKQLADLKFAITNWLAPLPRVYVGGNHFLYYNPAKQEDNVAPDIFVALDVARRPREKYQTWDEDDKFPDLVIEILAPRTRKDDLGAKKDLYARLGAAEYYVHDPRPEMRRRLFAGWQLVDGVYVPAPILLSGGIWSAVLGAELRVIGQWLRLIDPASGQPVPDPDETVQAWRAAEQRATQEEAARHEAEREMRREALARQAAEERAAHLERKWERMQADLARLRARQAGEEHAELEP